MIRFSSLYASLDATTRTTEKVDALKAYFQSAPPEDAAWAVYLMLGRRIGRVVPTKLVVQWAEEVTGLPRWLIDECNLVAGDFSETLSLLLPPPVKLDCGEGHDIVSDPRQPRVPCPRPVTTVEDQERSAWACASDADSPDRMPTRESFTASADLSQSPQPAPALHHLIENELLPLQGVAAEHQRRVITGLWNCLDTREKFLLHKLLGGEFRVGVSRLLVIRALAEFAGVGNAVMTHRVTGNWQPSAEWFRQITSKDGPAIVVDPLLPFPFMLANALDRPLADLGEPADWLLEWKWDGIRAQLIRRDGRGSLWSRGEEMIAGAFPDLMQDSTPLPPGTVIDGEVLAWDAATDRPLPFAALQKRLNRKGVELSFWPEVPLVFTVFDVLEIGGKDVRDQPLAARRELLRALPLEKTSMFRPSPTVAVGGWDEVDGLVAQARDRRVEGLMLKRLDATYQPGRPTGQWWKLKVQPLTIDAILVAAQPGRGRRAGLLTDYTFAIHDGEKLVTICKAYSGLTDEELMEVDRYVRKASRERFGPVYAVPPERVYEIGFEAIQESTRHKSGIALRFPRILRHRTDKTPAEADTIESVRALLHEYEGRL